MPINDVIIININPKKKHKVHLKSMNNPLFDMIFQVFLSHENLHHFSGNMITDC